MILYIKNLGNATKYIKKDVGNRILFIKDVQKTDGKAEMLILYWALSNKTGKCGGVKSFS